MKKYLQKIKWNKTKKNEKKISNQKERKKNLRKIFRNKPKKFFYNYKKCKKIEKFFNLQNFVTEKHKNNFEIEFFIFLSFNFLIFNFLPTLKGQVREKKNCFAFFGHVGLKNPKKSV